MYPSFSKERANYFSRGAISMATDGTLVLKRMASFEAANIQRLFPISKCFSKKNEEIFENAQNKSI